MLFVLWLVRYPLLRVAGNLLIVNDPLQASDAIVILGDDNFEGQRAKRAAEVFKDGWAPRIICSGRYLRPFVSIAQLEQHDLLGDGVPAGAIIPFPNFATNTGEEAFAVSHFISAHGWKRIIVVTSTYHTRRSRYIYEHVLPPGDEVRVVSAPDSSFHPDSWWQSYGGADLFFHETVGYFAAIWGLRHHDFNTPSGDRRPAS